MFGVPKLRSATIEVPNMQFCLNLTRLNKWVIMSRYAKQLRRNATKHHGKENLEELGTSTTTHLQSTPAKAKHSWRSQQHLKEREDARNWRLLMEIALQQQHLGDCSWRHSGRVAPLTRSRSWRSVAGCRLVILLSSALVKVSSLVFAN
jgi:hypothetical protein